MFTNRNISGLFKWTVHQLGSRSICLTAPSKTQFPRRYDPIVVEEIKNKVEQNIVYKDVYVEDFSSLFNNHDDNNNTSNESTKGRIEYIIEYYDTKKYELNKVPSTITLDNMKDLLKCDSNGDMNKCLRKLHQKEIYSLTLNELKTLYPNNLRKGESGFKFGIFDDNNNLAYGLWRNTLFPRMRKNQSRFPADRSRNAQLFGQNIVIDMSFSSRLKQNIIARVSHDIGMLLSHNHYNSREPFKITLCGVDYDGLLWNSLTKFHSNLIEYTEHTPEPYIQKFSSIKSQLVYINTFEKENYLEYDPNSTFVMAALSERDIIHDYLTPTILRHGVKSVNIPIDQHLLWNSGSKRLKLYTRLKLLEDLSNNVSWRETLRRHIPPSSLKTKEQIVEEEEYRFAKELNRINKIKKTKNHKNT